MIVKSLRVPSHQLENQQAQGHRLVSGGVRIVCEHGLVHSYMCACVCCLLSRRNLHAQLDVMMQSSPPRGPQMHSRRQLGFS